MAKDQLLAALIRSLRGQPPDVACRWPLAYIFCVSCRVPFKFLYWQALVYVSPGHQRRWETCVSRNHPHERDGYLRATSTASAQLCESAKRSKSSSKAMVELSHAGAQRSPWRRWSAETSSATSSPALRSLPRPQTHVARGHLLPTMHPRVGIDGRRTAPQAIALRNAV